MRTSFCLLRVGFLSGAQNITVWALCHPPPVARRERRDHAPGWLRRSWSVAPVPGSAVERRWGSSPNTASPISWI